MALATSMPLLGDLTLKFSRHSLHDSRFQLPNRTYNFYQCFEQAKQDIAFYNRLFINTTTAVAAQHGNREPETIFRFTGTTGPLQDATDEPEKHLSIFLDDGPQKSPGNDSENAIEHRADPTAYANAPSTTGCARETFEEQEQCSLSYNNDDEDSLSDAEELASYFSSSSAPCSPRRCEATGPTIARRTNSNRKRSIEYDEPVQTKRLCRPRLNFEKMQLCQGSVDDDMTVTSMTDTMKLFRPIIGEADL